MAKSLEIVRWGSKTYFDKDFGLVRQKLNFLRQLFLGMGELTDELLGLFFREVKVDG